MEGRMERERKNKGKRKRTGDGTTDLVDEHAPELAVYQEVWNYLNVKVVFYVGDGGQERQDDQRGQEDPREGR